MSHVLRTEDGECERHSRRFKVTRQYKSLSATTDRAVFLASLAERNDFKNCCEALTFEIQCILEPAATKNREWRKWLSS